MKHTRLAAVACLVVATVSSSARAQWLDTFDSYAPGPLAAQSLWDTFDNRANIDSDVSTAQAYTVANSVRVDGADSVVYDFVNTPSGRPIAGRWLLSFKAYVPTGATGASYLGLLNTYSVGGAKAYSLQLWFDATNDTVFTTGTGALSVPLRKDEWVTVLVCVDLDNDKVTAYYGSARCLNTRSWKNGMSAGGANELAVMEFFGGAGISESYMDNARLEKGGGACLCLSSSPNPVSAGQNLTFVSVGSSIPNGSLGGLMSWTVNGNLFISSLAFPFYGFGSRFTLQATVPPGLSGLQVGFKSLAAPGSGGLQLSNEDLVIFN